MRASLFPYFDSHEMNIEELTALIRRAATDAGFDLCGIAPATDAPEHKYFLEWIAAGHAGEMKYLEARDDHGELKRSSLARVAPWARSVIVCAINYNTAHPYSTQVQQSERAGSGAPLLADFARGGDCSNRGWASHGWISRYAWSREDYHDTVLRRLKQVEAALHEKEDMWGGHSCPPNLTTRSYVDTGPIVERVFAKYAGIGWTGKNTCLINQKKGSWLFLGVILTSLELTPDLPAPDRCGTCTRCIEACPTGAILAPYQLDSNKCIAYLTIEKRGSISEDLRPGIGRHIFGCDICQDVCPWNRKAPATTALEFEPRPGLFNPALAEIAEKLANMSDEEFRQAFRGSPIRRTKRSGLRRNVAIAMGNSGNRDFLPALEKLAADADQEEDESVAESARWAKTQLLDRTEGRSRGSIEIQNCRSL
jgi:epoxyqueuosine reductase